MDMASPAGGPWASTPPPPPPAGRPPLVRSRTNRKVAGVAAGVAAWLGIDPWAVRLILLVLLIPLGLGLFLYLLGWVLMPDQNGHPAVAESLARRLGEAPPWLPIVLLVAVVLFFFQSWWLGAPLAVFWAILLIGAGLWLYHNDAQRNRPVPAVPPGDPVTSTGGPAPAVAAPGSAAPVTQPVMGQPPAWSPATPSGQAGQQWATPSWGGAGAGPETPYPPTAWPQPAPAARAKTPKERSPLGRISFAVALVVLGVAALIDRTGIAHVSGRLYPALVLVVLGAGLLIGAVWGRAKLLILVGLVVVPIALLANLAAFVNHNGSGNEFYYPATAAGLHRDYKLGAGQIRLNLTRMAWPSSGTLTTHVTMGAGNVQISVPPEVTVTFHGHAGAGVIQFLYGPERSGIQLNDDAVSTGTPGGPTLNLWVHVLSGRVAVSRLSPVTATPAALPPVPLPISPLPAAKPPLLPVVPKAP